MRRIGVQYAQPGMVLSQDVYDSYGNMIMSQGTRITFDNTSTLARLGSGELFIQDRRVDDVPVTSIIPARLEGEATRQLRALLEETKTVVGHVIRGKMTAVNNVEKVMFSMVSHLFPAFFGEVNAAGCYSLTDYNYVHPVQSASLAVVMGRKLGLKEEELNKMGVAALVQNIGYAALPPGMMEEPTTLTPIELHEVRQHTQYGMQILHDYTHLSAEVIETVFQHHERWDGSGYPKGVKGKNISLAARINGIADTYYALVSRRPHRSSNLPGEAIEFVMAYSGELFDPELVQLLRKLMPLYPTGVMVKLNTGESGIITDARPGLIGRAIVRLCYDKNNQEIPSPPDLDLSESEHQHRLITEVIDY